MDQLYMIATRRKSVNCYGNQSEDLVVFYTESKIKVAEYLSGESKLSTKCWTFPQHVEITSADINLLTA